MSLTDTQNSVHEPSNNIQETGPAINPLARAYARRFPGEVAADLSRRGADAITRTIDGLPDDVAAGVIARLPHGHAIRILSSRDDKRIAAWLEAASLDHALAILLHVGTDRREHVLKRLSSRRTRRALRQLVVYPPATAGTALNPAALRLEASMSLADAVEFLRDDELEPDRRDNREPDRVIWLIDGDGHYRGLLDSGRALAARTQRAALAEFLVHIKPLRAETALTDASDSDQWLEHAELPVVDQHGHLLGSITRARLMAALGGEGTAGAGLIDGMSELAHQYFRVLAICLGDLFDTRGPRR